MKISLEWLREYVAWEEGPGRLEELLTRIGFSVEGREAAGSDWMLDVEITSNRPDCLGHIGLAREVAAATGQAFRLPEVRLAETGRDVHEWTSVADEEPEWCARYTARVIEGVKVGPSPAWLLRRLETVGLRGINNVVDVTNYVLLEAGQPLHAFDHARLAEGRIVVRRGRPGERLELIDRSQIELTDEMLVIADAARAVALAGIMGGLASEVTEATQTVLLESAHFDPQCIRRTSRALGQSSEASYRFERNVDRVLAEWASRRAAALTAELAGGRVARGVVDAWPGRQPTGAAVLRLSRLKALLGIEIDPAHVLAVLERLGLQPRREGEDAVRCTIPSWRGDLTREVDLIEEVIRLHGYERIPVRERIEIAVATPDAVQRTTRQATEALAGCGYYETVNVGFVEDRGGRAFEAAGFEPVRVRDAVRRTSNALRSSLLPSLMLARQRNQAAGNGRCDLYELAAVHRPQRGKRLPAEATKLGLLTDGDFRGLRGVIEAVVGRVDREAAVRCAPAEVLWADQGTGARVLVDGEEIGRAGQASAAVWKAFDADGPVWLAELDFAALVAREGRERRCKPLLRFPPIMRDLSLVLDERTPWARIAGVIEGLAIEELQELRFVDIYRGKGIPAGQKSLTLSLEFRRAERTLTHEEVDALQQRILAALGEQVGAELRS